MKKELLMISSIDDDIIKLNILCWIQIQKFITVCVISNNIYSKKIMN